MLNRDQVLKVIQAELRKQAEGVVIPEGLHKVNVRVALQIEGTVKQEPEQEYTPTAEIPLLPVLARFAAKVGVGGPKLLQLLSESCREAFAEGEPAGDYIECTKEAIRVVREELVNTLPKKTRAGVLRRTLQLTVLKCDRLKAA
jgi:hypothetical protein